MMLAAVHRRQHHGRQNKPLIPLISQVQRQIEECFTSTGNRQAFSKLLSQIIEEKHKLRRGLLLPMALTAQL
jgi:hypothetical protein